MSYVGNPIDTQNTFQSLQGKRFSGDGSETEFTLDVAPSSVLDIEVFVGNVRQDPNSAYTVSGTTLTFTGAPPSGTNNIYVVHQAKSVGTITPGANSVGITQLNVSDGSSGQALTTNGSGTLSFASVGLAGIDDQSSSNDDQLTITDTAVVVNEDSDDVDFRVEGNGEANLLYIDGGEDKIYSGIAAKSVHAAGYEPHIQIEGTSDNKNSVSLTQNSNNNGAPALIMCKTRGTAVAATTIVQDNDYLGNIIFGGADGNDRQTYGAHIIARVDGTPGENDMPTELKFGTTADGAASPTDRLILTADGRGLSQFTAKVWANYNGNGDALRDSHNISSVTDNGTGDYSFNFSTAFTNTSYCVVTGVYNGTSHGDFQDVDFMVNSTGNVRIGIGYVSGTGSQMSAHNALGVQIVILGDD